MHGKSFQEHIFLFLTCTQLGPPRCNTLSHCHIISCNGDTYCFPLSHGITLHHFTQCPAFNCTNHYHVFLQSNFILELTNTVREQISTWTQCHKNFYSASFTWCTHKLTSLQLNPLIPWHSVMLALKLLYILLYVYQQSALKNFIAVFAFCCGCVSEHYEKSKKDECSYLFSFVTPIHIWTCFITVRSY